MSIRQAEVTDVDRSLIKRTLFAQVNYDLDLIQAADRLLADANQAVATAGLGGKLKLERVVPIFWDQELDCLTARDAGEEVTQLRLTFVGDEWNGYAAHVQVMDGRIPVTIALIARASESRHRLCLNGRHPQDEGVLPRSRLAGGNAVATRGCLGLLAPVQLGLFNYPVHYGCHPHPRQKEGLWLYHTQRGYSISEAPTYLRPAAWQHKRLRLSSTLT